MWIELFLFFLLLTYFFYKWATKNYKVFEERGIPFRKPLPLLGNSWPSMKNKQNLHKTLLELYNEEKQNKIFGHYNFRHPIFIIHDPEIIKKVLVKEFDSFVNHQRIIISDNDPLLRGMLSMMKDQRWRNMRNTVTPAFTGAKMRAMFVLMNECFQETMKFLHEKFEKGNKTVEVELKDCFSKLSNDLIATTAFGLQINSFENGENEFFTIGKELTDMGGKVAVKILAQSLAPNLFKWFNLQLFDEKKTKYFVSLVVEAMKYREENKIVRPDMIQLLMEAQRESEHQWSEEDIVAQCFIFFFAAFENNANLLCTTCFELADNQDVQNKLYKEILETQKQLNGKTLDYDTIQKMKYLDMVVQESLRKWTLAPILDRDCNKDCKIYDDDGKLIFEFKEGDKIWFNVIGLHADGDHFEHSEVFDPERFSDENKNNIKQGAYLPFGMGPRACIGNRYALMQAKAMLFYLLKDFKVERSEKLVKNLYDHCKAFAITPKTGFWFKLSKRVPTTNL